MVFWHRSSGRYRVTTIVIFTKKFLKTLHFLACPTCWCAEVPAECTALLLILQHSSSALKPVMSDTRAHTLFFCLFFWSLFSSGCVPGSTRGNNIVGTLLPLANHKSAVWAWVFGQHTAWVFFYCGPTECGCGSGVHPLCSCLPSGRLSLKRANLPGRKYIIHLAIIFVSDTGLGLCWVQRCSGEVKH